MCWRKEMNFQRTVSLLDKVLPHLWVCWLLIRWILLCKLKAISHVHTGWAWKKVLVMSQLSPTDSPHWRKFCAECFRELINCQQFNQKLQRVAFAFFSQHRFHLIYYRSLTRQFILVALHFSSYCLSRKRLNTLYLHSQKRFLQTLYVLTRVLVADTSQMLLSDNALVTHLLTPLLHLGSNFKCNIHRRDDAVLPQARGAPGAPGPCKRSPAAYPAHMLKYLLVISILCGWWSMRNALSYWCRGQVMIRWDWLHMGTAPPSTYLARLVQELLYCRCQSGNHGADGEWIQNVSALVQVPRQRSSTWRGARGGAGTPVGIWVLFEEFKTVRSCFRTYVDVVFKNKR